MPRPFETTARQITTDSTDRPAALRNAGVHPAECRSAANGIAESTCPNWPRLPIHWLSCGTFRPLNQVLLRRSTDVKVAASPAPTRIRPTTATPSVGETA